MEIELVGSKSKKVNLSDDIFSCAFNEGLVHQAVTTYLAGARQGSKAQKSRSDVSGGGSKPWRQKGTGRARAGTIRSPIWEGGGVTFAARPRDYSKKINKKMYRRAMAVILSELLRQKRLNVINEFSVSAPKTKELVEKLKKQNLKEALIIISKTDENLMLAARNLKNVEVCEAANINPAILISYDQILITEDALKNVEEKLS